MADPNTPNLNMPPRPVAQYGATAAPGASLGAGLGAGLNSNATRPTATQVAPADRGMFSTGVLVALVFIVVAILAGVIFSNTDMLRSGSAVTDTPPAVSSDVAPDTTVPATAAPEAMTPAPAAPVVEPAAPAVEPATPEAAPANP